ncbi:isochorismatase family protein [Aeromonas caviae]|uniref:isochorismatase family protein n=1 Tax=Aeromonas caviae TaxID=648 RepID=UPI0025B6AEAB|nr:isochorismatase family protein [Aeromonas caviae]
MSSLSRPALLIIDIQVGLLHGPEAPHAGAETLANINRLGQAARSAALPRAGGAPHGLSRQPHRRWQSVLAACA